MKFGRTLIAAGALLMLAACGDDAADETGVVGEPSRYDALTITYVCDGGAEVQAIYFNFEDGNALAALFHDGKLAPLRIMPSASGAKYASLNEELGWRWHTKGGEAVLSFMAADHTAQEEVILGGCRNTLLRDD